MTTSTLIYSPLLEDETNIKGWNKQTVEFVLDNKSKIKSTISSYAKSMNKILSQADIEDCFTEVLLYFHDCSDYDLSIASEKFFKKEGMKAEEKAETKEETGIIPLEGYIYKFVKFIIMRHVTTQLKIETKEVSSIIHNKDEAEELNILDFIADKTEPGYGYEKLHYDLDTICKQYEYQRYKYLLDIFQLWFIRLLLIKHNKENSYKEILNTLGINKNQIHYMKKQIKHSEAMIDIAKAISVSGVDRAIEILRQYTYSAERLERLIEMI